MGTTYQQRVESIKMGKYHPIYDEIVLNQVLGKAYYTKSILSHISILGKEDYVVQKEEGMEIGLKGPQKHFITSLDLKSINRNDIDIKLLIQRHLVLTHEMIHRRLIMDTSWGFVLRFCGLGKIYLEENIENLSNGEIGYLETLKKKFHFLMEAWESTHEYLATYNTLIEVNYLLHKIFSRKENSNCDCSVEDFENHIGNISTYNKREVVEYLKDLRKDILSLESLKDNPFADQSIFDIPDDSFLYSILLIRLKEDFTKLYLMTYFWSNYSFSIHNFALNSYEDFLSHTLNFQSFIKLYDDFIYKSNLRLEDLIGKLQDVFFADDWEKRINVSQVFRRADIMGRKACKIQYVERILTAKKLLRFHDFFDFVESKLKLWDDKSILWTIPEFESPNSNNPRISSVRLMNGEDHKAFFGQLDSLQKEAGYEIEEEKNVGKAKNEQNLQIKEKQFFDEYAFNLIYYGLISFKEYNQRPDYIFGGLVPFFSIDGYSFEELASGGHDVGYLLNELFN